MAKKIKDISEFPWQWKIVQYISYTILFIVPLYFNTRHWYPFEPTKTALIFLGVFLMVIFFTLGLLKNKNKFSINLNFVSLSLFLFLIFSTISAIWGIDPHTSFFGTFGFPTGILLFYTLALFSFFIGFFIKKDKKFLINLLLSSFLSSIIVALLSYTGNHIFKIFNDYSSTIGNSSYAGAYLLFNVCFGFGLLFYFKEYWKKILIFLATLFIILCPIFFNINIFSGSISFSNLLHNPLLLLGVANGAAIGVACAILITICFYLLFSSKKSIKMIGLVLFLFFIGSITFIGFNFMDSNSRIHKVYLADKGDNRFVSWDIAKQSFMVNPILGTGFGNFEYSYQKYFNPDIFNNKNSGIEPYFPRVHNVILEYLSSGGILGLLSYLVLFVISFIYLFKINENETANIKYIRGVLIGALFGYFLQNMFVFDVTVTYLMFFTVIGISMGLCEYNFNIDISNNIKNIISIVSIPIFLLLIIYFVVLPWRESRKLGIIASSNNIAGLKDVRSGLQDTSMFGGVEDTASLSGELLNIYSLNSDKINSNNKDIFLNDIDSIIDSLNKDIKKYPNNFKSNMVLGNFYLLKMITSNKFDENTWNNANISFNNARALNKNNPELYISFVKMYLIKGDFKNARIYSREAMSIAPMYKDSYDVAHLVLQMDPNNNFENHVKEMELKWIKNN